MHNPFVFHHEGHEDNEAKTSDLRVLHALMVNTMSWAGKRALASTVQCRAPLLDNRCGFNLMHNLWFFTMKDMKIMKQRHQTFVSFMLFMVNTMSWAGRRALVLSVQCRAPLPGNRCGFNLMHNPWFFTMKGIKIMKQRHANLRVLHGKYNDN